MKNYRKKATTLNTETKQPRKKVRNDISIFAATSTLSARSS